MLEVTIEHLSNGANRISGSVEPARVTALDLIEPGQEMTPLELDELGRFELVVSGSLVSLVLTTAQNRRIRSEIVSLN